MAKERRTDITSTPGRTTTRREQAVEPGTEKLQAVGRTTRKLGAVGTGPQAAVGKTTAMRPVTGRATTIRPGTRKTTSINSVTGGYTSVRKKKFPFAQIIILLALLCGGYYGWDYYSTEKARAEQEMALRRAEFERQEKERLDKLAAIEEAKRKAEAEEAQKRKADEDRQLAEIEARKKAAAEAEAARLREAEQAAEKRKADAAARQEALARAAKALQLLKTVEEEARKESREGKFAQAAKRMEDGINQAIIDLKNGEEKPFERTKKTARLFGELMEQTQALPETSAKNMFWFVMKDGSRTRGKVESDIGNEIVLMGNGGVRTTLNREKIASRKEITQQEIDTELQKVLDEKAAGASTGVDWFLAGLTALECNRPDLAVKSFNKAEELDIEIAQNVREHRARLLLASGVFNRSIHNERIAKERLDRLVNEYGDTRAAKMYLNSQTQEETVVAAVAKKDATAGEAKDISDELDKARDEVKNPTMAKADALVQQAKGLEEKAQSASNRKLSNELYKDAVVKLSQAMAMYQELQKDKKVDQAALDAKITDAARKLYWCRKLQTL